MGAYLGSIKNYINNFRDNFFLKPVEGGKDFEKRMETVWKDKPERAIVTFFTNTLGAIRKNHTGVQLEMIKNNQQDPMLSQPKINAKEIVDALPKELAASALCIQDFIDLTFSRNAKHAEQLKTELDIAYDQFVRYLLLSVLFDSEFDLSVINKLLVACKVESGSLDDLERNAKEARDTITQSQTQLSHINLDIPSYKLEKETAQNSLTSNQENLSKLKNKISNLLKDLDTLKNTKLENFRQRIENTERAHKTNIRKNKTRKSEITQDKENWETEEQKLTNEKAELPKDDESKNQIDTLVKRIEDINIRKITCDREVVECENSNKILEDNIAQIGKVLKEIKALNDNIDSFIVILNNLNASLNGIGHLINNVNHDAVEENSISTLKSIAQKLTQLQPAPSELKSKIPEKVPLINLDDYHHELGSIKNDIIANFAAIDSQISNFKNCLLNVIRNKQEKLTALSDIQRCQTDETKHNNKILDCQRKLDGFEDQIKERRQFTNQEKFYQQRLRENLVNTTEDFNKLISRIGKKTKFYEDFKKVLTLAALAKPNKMKEYKDSSSDFEGKSQFTLIQEIASRLSKVSNLIKLKNLDKIQSNQKPDDSASVNKDHQQSSLSSDKTDSRKPTGSKENDSKKTKAPATEKKGDAQHEGVGSNSDGDPKNSPGTKGVSGEPQSTPSSTSSLAQDSSIASGDAFKQTTPDKDESEKMKLAFETIVTEAIYIDAAKQNILRNGTKQVSDRAHAEIVLGVVDLIKSTLKIDRLINRVVEDFVKIPDNMKYDKDQIAASFKEAMNSLFAAKVYQRIGLIRTPEIVSLKSKIVEKPYVKIAIIVAAVAVLVLSALSMAWVVYFGWSAIASAGLSGLLTPEFFLQSSAFIIQLGLTTLLARRIASDQIKLSAA